MNNHSTGVLPDTTTVDELDDELKNWIEAAKQKEKMYPQEKNPPWILKDAIGKDWLDDKIRYGNKKLKDDKYKTKNLEEIIYNR